MCRSKTDISHRPDILHFVPRIDETSGFCKSKNMKYYKSSVSVGDQIEYCFLLRGVKVWYPGIVLARTSCMHWFRVAFADHKPRVLLSPRGLGGAWRYAGRGHIPTHPAAASAAQVCAQKASLDMAKPPTRRNLLATERRPKSRQSARTCPASRAKRKAARCGSVLSRMPMRKRARSRRPRRVKPTCRGRKGTAKDITLRVIRSVVEGSRL